ncbi:phosphotransferase [Quadrisphaera sp. DSM 44207]|uniref:phosphotransferase n=1 Tax=Quadrisphaera sp. DSM 44207 TaxID=1881057 RepID=UPI00088315E6|nr:phosphotransferase [Quadrisphaera sp. DSM 44207]SDQ47433.1 Ser/Thr protein kinase RdoA involved in Cpx stress response, MazF antagonist [Quadrisphaera sp. DSM 44207]
MSAAAAVAAAVDAAAAVGRRLGLPDGEAVLLHQGANAVVHLSPSPVVARVALMTARARPRPAEALAREVLLAGWLAERGAAVVPPTQVVDAGPHEHDGWAMSLWPHLAVPADGSGHPFDAPEAVAAALAALHDALAGFGQELPGLEESVGDAARCLEVAGGWLPPPLLGALLEGARDAAETASQVDVATPGRRALHGDPHPRNLLLVGGAALWCDLEDTLAGPVEWDLAVMGRSQRHDGAAAVRAYAAATGTAPDADLLAALNALRWWQVQCWWVLYASVREGDRPDALASVAAWASARSGSPRA